MTEPPDRETLETFLVALAPFAPHFSEELWQRTGHEPSIFHRSWPEWDEQYTRSDTVTVAIQINGKLRGTVAVNFDEGESDVLKTATEDSAIARYLDGKQIRKQVYVKNRILNLVVG